MDPSVNKAQNMVLFVKSIFRKSEDIGALTVKQIRNAYLKEKSISALSADEKSTLSTIIRQEFIEVSKREQDDKPLHILPDIKIEDVKNDVIESTADKEVLERLESEVAVKKNKRPAKCLKTEDLSEMLSFDDPESDGIGNSEFCSDNESENSDSEPLSSDSAEDSSCEDSRTALKKRQNSPLSDGEEELPSSKKPKMQSSPLSDSEEELPSSKKPKMKIATVSNSESEDEPLSKKTKKCTVLLSNRKFSKYMNSQIKEEPVSKKVKKSLFNADSEDEPKTIRNQQLNSDSEEEFLSENKNATSNNNNDSFTGLKKKVRKGKKVKDGSEVKILRMSSSSENQPPKKASKKVEENITLKNLRSCCHAAGLFVHYNRVFQDCDTDSSKELALLKLLKEAGLKSKPTVEACKRLKLRREEKKAMEDLDPANIINESGRSCRQNVYSAYQRNKPVPQPTTINVLECKKAYSRLKGIVDSEESNSD